MPSLRRPPGRPLVRRAGRAVAVLATALAMQVHAAPPPADDVLTGQVLEVKQGGGYTYLRLKTPGGEAWAAVAGAQVNQGALVRINRPMTMERFESKALGRTFDKIYFGELSDPKAKAAAQGGMPAMAMPMPGAAPAAKPGMPPGAPAQAAAKVAKVAKAEGAEGRTVAEVIGGKARLKDKTIAVRGQVVKVSLGILGKNWVHLQDGTGSAADGSNDLIVTTQDKPAVGDVVHARGTVRTDVNVGSGYSYAVLIEGATLRK